MNKLIGVVIGLVVSTLIMAGGMASLAVAQEKAKPAAKQAKSPIYTVFEVNVTDVDAYKKEFVPLMAGNVEKAGGKILAGTQEVITLEGAPQKLRVAIQRWDSMEQLQAYRDSAEFKQARKLGEKYVTFRSVVLQGVPDSSLK
jgi:uncharacterized protein (DUF1330 family)